MDLAIVEQAIPVLLQGLRTTLTLFVISSCGGFVLALALAIMRVSGRAMLEKPAKYYSMVLRGTPLLVQIFLLYYGLGQLNFVHQSAVLWWLVGDGTHCAAFALALNTAAYTSEILRGGLQSVPKGLVEAAQAAGMSRALRFRRIEFPLAWRQSLPAYGNELVLNVKGTSLASTITVLEITGYAKRLMSQTYAVLEVFAIAGTLYLVINLTLTVLVRLVESRLVRHRRR